MVGEYADVVNGCAQETPELEQTLADAQTERAALVSWSPDRLSRSVALFLKRQEECRQRGIALYFVN